MDNPKILIGLDLSVASQSVIEVLIDDPSEPDIFDEIARANLNRHEILELLLSCSDTPEQVKSFITDRLHLPVRASSMTIAEKAFEEEKPRTLLQKMQTLTVGERIQLALKGGREIRGILVKDTNKEVMLSVLENQKVTEAEIEMIARSRSVPEEAFRKISKNREWLKNYAIVFALVTNPKTPSGIAVPLINILKIKDLVILEKNKNVPEVVRSAAKRILIMKKPK